MASIQIPGVGAVEVPEFASEYTLNQLLHTISSQEANSIGRLTDIAKGIGTETGILQATLASQRGEAADTSALRSATQIQNKTSLQTLQHMKKQHKDIEKAMSKQTSILPRHTAQILRTAGAMVGGKGISDVLGMMPDNWGQGIALATKVVGEFADSQRRLTDVGFGLGTSILNTTEAVAGFNVPLSEIERIAGTHAVTLDYLNEVSMDSVDQMEKWNRKGVKPGILAFAQLSHSVRTSMAEFGNFGLTVTEVDSYLAEYLESDRKRGITADASTSNLTANFKALAGEVSAYAADTGRNRKDLMKAQLENMNRTDASTYSMMLRMKNEDAAADTFEKNLTLITNEMKSRYGDNADAMIDAWIVAQTQGRGLEATETGAEFMAMLGPAGAIFDQMARSGEAIDPASFKLFDDSLKESVKQYDTQNFALLARQKESLNIASNMIMYSRDTSEATREMWKKDIDNKVKEQKAGELVLKANEAMVEVTTNLQKGLVSVTNSLVGPEGALSGELNKALKSVGQFSDALALFAKGETLDAASQIGQMIKDNPWQFLLGSSGAAWGVLGTLGIVGSGAVGGAAGTGAMMSGGQQSSFAQNLAAQNIKGGSVQGGNWVDREGGKSAIKGGKFMSNGVEYQLDSQGNPKPTAKGMKTIKGGGKIGGKGIGSLFSLGIAAYGGYQEYGAEQESFAAQTKDMDKGSPAYKRMEEESNKRIRQIIKNTLAKGGGGALGGAAMGTMMGLFTANPALMALAAGTGAYLGWELGDEMTKPDEKFNQFTTQMEQSASASKTLSADEIKTRYQRDAKQKQAESDPTYLQLKSINKHLQDQGITLDTIAGASSSTAIDIKKNGGSTPSNNGGPPK